MGFFRRWFGVGILIIFGVLSLSKGYNLWSMGTNVDGDGIGIQFLTFEISDHVPVESISTYSIGFIFVSLIAFISSVVIIRRNLKVQ